MRWCNFYLATADQTTTLPKMTSIYKGTKSHIETLPISNRYASASLGKVFLDFFELITTFWEGLVTFFLLIKVEFTGRRLREN